MQRPKPFLNGRLMPRLQYVLGEIHIRKNCGIKCGDRFKFSIALVCLPKWIKHGIFITFLIVEKEMAKA